MADAEQVVQTAVTDFEDAVPVIEAVGTGLKDLVSQNASALANDLAPLASIPNLPAFVKMAFASSVGRQAIAGALVQAEKWAAAELAKLEAKKAPVTPANPPQA